MSEEFKPGTEAFRSVKDKINQEGWQQDDDGDGQAAVFIGTKEEAEAARQRLESKEATFADLRAYLAVNSVVEMGVDEIKTISEDKSNYIFAKEAKSFLSISPGVCTWSSEDGNVAYRLYFKSKEGSLKRCDIDPKKIEELAVIENQYTVADSLQKLGFFFSGHGHFDGLISELRSSRLRKAYEARVKNTGFGEFEF